MAESPDPRIEVPYTRLPRTTLWLLRGDDFVMGGSEEDETPRFEAEVRPFYIGKAPITNEEYEVYAPSHLRGASSPGDSDPAVGLSFRDAVGYCAWYSEASGKTFRLPTELEWEFACRGGVDGIYSWGDHADGADGRVWDAASSDGRCHSIEGLAANEAGLYDMLGNVWEWTASLYQPYPVEPGDGRDDSEARGPRAVRGGSFRHARGEVGCATRRSCPEDTVADDLGFRIVRLL